MGSETRYHHYILSACVLIGLALNARASDAETRDWQAFYGEQGLQFEVVRNGKPVGDYTTTFEQSGDQLIVETEMNLDITVLWLLHYRYQYRGREVWQEGSLQSVTSKISDNGKTTGLSLKRRGDELTGEGPTGPVTVPAGTLPTHHYNAAVINHEAVLNTLTGKVNQVSVEPLPAEQVRTGERSRRAIRYRYTGELHDTDAWYDEQGRWVKLLFKGSDGSDIELVCRQCGDEGESS